MAKLENDKTSSEIQESVDATDALVTGPGDLLKAARKKLKLSKPEVARQLNLSPSVIEQLESNQYTNQIPDAFIRGYLRTYARAVEIDEEQVVAIYTQKIGREIVRNHYVPSTDITPVKNQIGSHMLWFKVLSFTLIVTLLVLGWIAFSQRNQDDSATADNKTSALNENRNNLDDTLELNEANSAANKAAAEVPTKASDNSLDLEEQTQGATATAHLIISQVESEPLVTTQKISDNATSVEAELEFTFLDDCWVQVIDSNDDVLAVGLKSSGRRFSVSGIVPIKVVLGKPRAVSLQFNNELVDLTIYPAGQTARFTLGEDLSFSSSNLRD